MLELHGVCDFLYDLCQAFNKFYGVCHVVNADTALQRRARAALVEMVAHTLRTHLHVLGIDTIDRL